MLHFCTQDDTVLTCLMCFFHEKVCHMIYDNVLEPCIMTNSDEKKFATSK